MAKTEGNQEIPSVLLDAYRATLGEQKPNKGVQKRYPFRLPQTQTKRGVPTINQRTQRARFLLARDSFNERTFPERQKWYAARPEWNSLLWYYNFFIMSSLNDVLGADARGAQVIKSIQNRTLEVPLAGTTITHVTPVEPTKTVVMLWGASYKYDWDQVGDIPYAWAWAVYPIWGTLNATNISLTWGIAAQQAGNVSLQIIEYI